MLPPFLKGELAADAAESPIEQVKNELLVIAEKSKGMSYSTRLCFCEKKVFASDRSFDPTMPMEYDDFDY